LRTAGHSHIDFQRIACHTLNGHLPTRVHLCGTHYLTNSETLGLAFRFNERPKLKSHLVCRLLAHCDIGDNAPYKFVFNTYILTSKLMYVGPMCGQIEEERYEYRRMLLGGAENAGVENAGAVTDGKP